MAPKNTPDLPPVHGHGPPRGSNRRAVAAQLAREKRSARRRKILTQVAVGLVVVAVVVAVTIAVLSQRDSDVGSAGSGTTPPGLTSGGAVRFGAAGVPVTLQAVEDFQCPVCQQFESANANLLESYRDGDQVAVEYRPIAFLDRMSSSEYSSRALNASMCVLEDAGKDPWLDYHQSLYATQPAEGGSGLPDSDLVSMANDVGAAGDDVESCIEDRRYDDWAQQTTKAAFADGVSGTPTLFVNGTKLDAFDSATIERAVSAAGGS